jgi:hypothetical protein
MKRIILCSMAAMMLAACTMTGAVDGTPPPGLQYEPQAGDSELTHDQVFLDLVELQTLESSPPQFMLALRGSLPTPCHQLRVAVSKPDLQAQVIVEVYSLAKADTACAQVLEPFAADISLGSYPAGHYILVVNGEEVAEFDA